MKNFILIIFLFSFRDTLFSQQQTPTKLTQLEPLVFNHFLYQSKVINEKQAFEILKNTNEPTIMNLVLKAKRTRGLQPIGYLGIPAIIAFVGFQEASISKVYRTNGTTIESKKTKFEMASFSCLALSVACPTLSFVIKRKHKQSVEEAIKLYNQKY